MKTYENPWKPMKTYENPLFPSENDVEIGPKIGVEIVISTWTE